MSWGAVFIRASALLLILPIFSTTNTPIRVRVAFAALLAMFVSSAMTPVPPEATKDVFGIVALFAKEVAVGLVLGFSSRMVFYTLDLVGSLITSEMGLGAMMSPNAMSPTPQTVPGTLLNYVAAVMWVALDLPHWLIVGFKRTYDLIPAGGVGLSEELAIDMVARTGKTFVIGLQMTAPILAVSFVISFVFAVLARSVPQMNVFSESFGVRVVATLAVFGMTVQLMGQHIANYLNALPEDFHHVATLMGQTAAR
jgi:flagellar biosynthetic protein FliR